MSRTQQRWTFLFVIIFAVVLAACSPSATPTPTTRPTTAPPTAAATAEAVEAGTTESSSAATVESTKAAVSLDATTAPFVAQSPTPSLESVATEEATVMAASTEMAAMTSEATEMMAATAEMTMEATTEATAELGTIVDVAKADGNFTTLLAALDKAGLTDTLNGAGPFTVFAPTDDAFKALLASTSMTAADLLSNPDLADILKYHVVSGNVTADDLATFKTQDNPDLIVVPTLDGDKTLSITVADDGSIAINGVAKVTLKNVQASNGVIHVIDAVLMPPTAAATAEATMAAMATEMATEVAMVPTAMMATSEATMEMMSTAEATMSPESTTTAVAGGSTVTVSADGEVVVALAAGLSGEGIAPLGVDIQRGAELALQDRPTVTVGGKTFTVKLDVQDDQCSADGGQAVANRFASEAGVVGVVGPMCSSACRSAAPILDAADYTSISPSCTAPDLTTSSYSSFNRAVVSDAFQGAIAANYIYNVLGIKTIATIHDGSPYGEGLVTVVTDTFEKLGGKVVSSDAVTVGDTDFRGLLDDVAQNNPGLIYFGGFPAEAARLIQQRADAGLDKVPFMGADGINGTEVVSLAGESAEGVYSTKAIPADSAALTSFIDRYVAAYGEQPPAPYHANAYDGVNILLDAVEATATVDASGNLVISRDDVAKYVRSLKDFQGLTGVLNADGTGETSLADIGVFVVKDGVFVQTYTGNMSAAGEVTLNEYTAPVVPEATMAATMEAMSTEAAPMAATAEMMATAEATASS